MREGFRWLLGFALVLTLMFSPVFGLSGSSGIASASTTANVTINATPGWVSISNNLTTFDFGTVLANTDEDTTLTGFNVTNAGSVACNITIACDNWTHTAGSNDWVYGAAAENTSELIAGLDGETFNRTIPGTGTAAVNLTNDLDDADSQLWGIEIDAPTAFTHGDPQQTNVTLTATMNATG